MTYTPRIWPSMAKTLIDSGKGPASVWRQYLSTDRMQSFESDAMKRGSVIDALVFVTKLVTVGKQSREHDPKKEIIVSGSLFKECSDAASSISSFLTESGVELSDCTVQEKLKWTASGGVFASGTPDFVWNREKLIIDLKSSYSLSDEDVQGTIKRYQYDIQAAAYLEAYTALGRGKHEFAWIFTESGPPYLCRWVIAGPKTIGEGTAKWMEACRIFKECVASDKWPGPKALVLA